MVLADHEEVIEHRVPIGKVIPLKDLRMPELFESPLSARRKHCSICHSHHTIIDFVFAECDVSVNCCLQSITIRVTLVEMRLLIDQIMSSTRIGVAYMHLYQQIIYL